MKKVLTLITTQMTILSQHTCDTVIEVLEKRAEEALSWFLFNGISANADKFQAIFCKKNKKSTARFHS